jgi:uncharacterized membrane protein
MPWLKKNLLSPTDEDAIVAAIGRAEEGNRGEVRVHLEKKCPHPGGPLARAEEKFYRLGMHQTLEATGVILYVAVQEQVAAVYAGPGVHTCCPKSFWKEITEEVSRGAREGELIDTLIAAVDSIGDLLREHIPGTKEIENELPDEVSVS